ncbi:hypothetical protein AVEN_204870-1 [Araneus ventricosus]|uniref:Uncharacterized protein n=1 Tax=Araneus ventricosus TaxID=182803 RepID=A0A4Y2LXW7_ARAVE|nr:hypothetical protein AVEN_204870-1 [Araneus ventricosus]
MDFRHPSPELLSIQRIRTFKRHRQPMTEAVLMAVSFTEFDHKLPVPIGIPLGNRHEPVAAAEAFCWKYGHGRLKGILMCFKVSFKSRAIV